MNIRKLLDWRKALIYIHRWMGIVGGLLFIAWFISGIVFAYWTMPTYSNSERLGHLAPIDLSTARVEPMDAAKSLNIKPTRLRVGMSYDGRPVYRFQGDSVYADTGQAFGRADAEQAVAFVRTLEPEHAATVQYDELREDIDLWTAGSRGQLPLHKIAVGDAADSYYYISAKTGEPVMKTDRASRFWGFLGPVLHQFYFTPLRKRADLWDQIILWSALAGSLMCLSGLVIGIWRVSIRGRFRQKRQASHTPYSGWMRWHHYAGLLFGLVSFTWIFSGGLAFDSFGIGTSTNPTAEQRNAATGGPIKLDSVTLEGLRQAIAAITPSFTTKEAPKEADVLQFRGELYVLAANGPQDRTVIGLTERAWNPSTTEYRMAWLSHPERGSFSKFDDAVMMDIARDAMPNVAIADATWLHEYDNYYRSRLGGQPLPVLRVQYADPNKTWLYLDPHRGSVVWREEPPSRRRRWLYNGLHKFDFPVLYDNRPLWDLAIILLSIGGLALSLTSLMPGLRRLRRHGNRVLGVNPARPIITPDAVPYPEPTPTAKWTSGEAPPGSG